MEKSKRILYVCLRPLCDKFSIIYGKADIEAQFLSVFLLVGCVCVRFHIYEILYESSFVH